MYHPSTSRWLRDPLYSTFAIFFLMLIFFGLVQLGIMYAIVIIVGLFSLIATSLSSLLFDDLKLKSFMIVPFYCIVIFPFILAYTKFSNAIEFRLLLFLSATFLLIVLTFINTIEDIFTDSIFFNLLSIAKKLLRKKRLRYSFSIITISIFAGGLTSLWFILPSIIFVFLAIIVILQLTNTMMKNVKERRDEILILVSAGLNPDQLSIILFTEGLIVGFLGVGLGYSLGLYFLITSQLSLTAFEISLGWMIEIQLLCVATALISATFPARKASMITTPSLLKRWWNTGSIKNGLPQTSIFQMPIKIRKENIDRIKNFFLRYVKKLESSYPERTSDIQIITDDLENKVLWEIKFKYFYESDSPYIAAENAFRIIEEPTTGEHVLQTIIKILECKNSAIPCYEVATTIASTYRKLTLELTEDSYYTSSFSSDPKWNSNLI